MQHRTHSPTEHPSPAYGERRFRVVVGWRGPFGSAVGEREAG